MTIPILCLALLHGYVVLDQVSINGAGPYRFLVDTGTQSTALKRQIAQTMKLVPTYRVTLETATGSQIVPATTVREITVGPLKVEDLEILWYDVHDVLDDHIDGILGQNFLSRFDFLLDFKHCEFTIGPPSGLADLVDGEKVYFQNNEGRMIIPVRFSSHGRPSHFVLDSGASVLVLPPELATTFEAESSSQLQTNIGEETVRRGIVRTLFIGGSAFQNVPTVIQKTALLPATLFDSIYVNSASGYLVLNPRKKKEEESFRRNVKPDTRTLAGLVRL
jgi:predicted aspartyl protease